MLEATYEDVRNVGGNTLVVDVREPSELAETGVLPKSINIPLGQLEQAFKLDAGDFSSKYGVSKPALDQEMICSCKAGGRAARATQTLTGLGYTNVRCYKGSWTDWAAKLGL